MFLFLDEIFNSRSSGILYSKQIQQWGWIDAFLSQVSRQVSVNKLTDSQGVDRYKFNTSFQIHSELIVFKFPIKNFTEMKVQQILIINYNFSIKKIKINT